MNQAEKETITTQLKDEEKALKDLEKAYKKALKDTQEKIRLLNSRSDLQNKQSVIYQKKYQQAIKKQINDILDALHNRTYTSANDFFTASYQNGYIGSMYELQSRGIPMTIPVSTSKMMTAIQTKSKLSQSYYEKQGLSVQNIRTLKKQIAMEITRGIASGKSWLETAESVMVQRQFQISKSDAMRIVRTEGNRINQQARLDAGDDAIDAGCDLLKQWDATLDGATREDHRIADGQIVRWDQDFIVGGEKMSAPSVGGSAKNVCNCRCQLLKRARWALDEDELEALKKRASYYNLDKTKSFEDYKKKYLKLPANAQTVPPADVFGLDKNTKKLQKTMSPEDWKEYKKLIQRNPDIARAYNHCDDLKTIRYKKGSGYYQDSSGTIEWSFPDKKYIDEGMSKYSTSSHEYFHFIDTFVRKGKHNGSGLTWDEMDTIRRTVGPRYTSKMTEHNLSNSDQFLRAMRKDFEKIVQNQEKFFEECRNNRNTTTGAQDASDGWGLGRIWWGHGDRYYNRNYNNMKQWEKYTNHSPTKDLQKAYKDLGFDASNQAKTKKQTRQYETASELWANIGCGKTTGGKEDDFNKRWFEHSGKAMDDILKGVN